MAPLSAEHEEVRVITGPRSGLTMAVAVHRTVDGRSLGGCRMSTYASADDAIYDVKRLSRAMTFKAVVAGLRLGGGKGVIALDPAAPPLTGDRRLAALHDFGELVESFDGRYVTAQDVGVSLEDMTYVVRFTDHLAGHPIEDGGSGDPSPYTAHGVEIAIRASLRDTELAHSHVVVIGLGHVGGALAERLSRAGATLTVTDVNPERRAFADELGARWVEPDAALDVEADVLAPCALGGILHRETVVRLRTPIVAGAANNQLADDSVGDVLRRRGVLWAPDFIA
ncbi:MAG: leucine dehydrogenase, partial [Thermoleophilaceae bacterium]|nr:leucine dehydrogenase [Thermoleophilaceae bacterium]